MHQAPQLVLIDLYLIRHELISAMKLIAVIARLNKYSPFLLFPNIPGEAAGWGQRPLLFPLNLKHRKPRAAQFLH